MSAPNQPNSESAQSSKGLIMVVEPETRLREGIMDVLELDQYDVIAFETSQQALERSRADRQLPDLILLAVSPPAMSGLAFVHEVRKEPRWLRVPFILLVDSYELTNENRGKAQSVADCLFKPFDAEALYVVVAASLKRSRANK